MKYRPTEPIEFASPSGWASERESNKSWGFSIPAAARTNWLASCQWISPLGIR